MSHIFQISQRRPLLPQHLDVLSDRGGKNLLGHDDIAKGDCLRLLLMTLEYATVGAGLVRQDLVAIQQQDSARVLIAFEDLGQPLDQLVLRLLDFLCRAGELALRFDDPALIAIEDRQVDIGL